MIKLFKFLLTLHTEDPLNYKYGYRNIIYIHRIFFSLYIVIRIAQMLKSLKYGFNLTLKFYNPMLLLKYFS